MGYSNPRTVTMLIDRRRVISRTVPALSTYRRIIPAQSYEASLSSPSQHSHDLHASILERFHFPPERIEFSIFRRIIIQGDIARSIVYMDRCNDDMRGACVLRDQGKDRDRVARLIMMRLVVQDQARSFIERKETIARGEWWHE